MAQLLSEDTACLSLIDIKRGPLQIVKVDSVFQNWQQITLILVSGSYKLTTLANENFTLCREPLDEVLKLLSHLGKLGNAEEKEVFFEPAEPSFELCFTRTLHGGIMVEAWLDASNGSTGIFSGDACGIRFSTNDELLLSFVKGLQEEFF